MLYPKRRKEKDALRFGLIPVDKKIGRVYNFSIRSNIIKDFNASHRIEVFRTKIFGGILWGAI